MMSHHQYHLEIIEVYQNSGEQLLEIDAQVTICNIL
jgi:hypothetical protein